jgi:hypothetical protein
MMIAINGCLGSILHRRVEFFKCQDGTSVYICANCGEEFIENEDTGCGG